MLWSLEQARSLAPDDSRPAAHAHAHAWREAWAWACPAWVADAVASLRRTRLAARLARTRGRRSSPPTRRAPALWARSMLASRPWPLQERLQPRPTRQRTFRRRVRSGLKSFLPCSQRAGRKSLAGATAGSLGPSVAAKEAADVIASGSAGPKHSRNAASHQAHAPCSRSNCLQPRTSGVVNVPNWQAVGTEVPPTRGLAAPCRRWNPCGSDFICDERSGFGICRG
ncbi:hypothetical protein XTPLMG728_3066 [Xanthomonas translucens pv. poae]|uniref:Uncharacterized protein n=1 Tax=Xanthomonas graminis pv. poae TaxID=227946 RepID=A0A0K3A1H6_9XANT|nr:hypothetical protein XTPLMG728_3066 [Xanthomonas translucens pv. poae]